MPGNFLFKSKPKPVMRNSFWFLILLSIAITSTCTNFSFAQINPASPSNWLYPDGNSEGTRYNKKRSDKQDINLFKKKWSTPFIAGDVQPLIGNIVNNSKILPSMKYAPNEIVAVIGEKLVVIDGRGKLFPITKLPPYIKNASVLFDTLSTQVSANVTNPVLIGLETIEYENLRDSLAYAYIAGYNPWTDTIALLKRLAIDLRIFAPNIYAGVKPVFGRSDGANIIIYTTVNMSNPTVLDPFAILPPYFRGFTQFNTGTLVTTYPLPDIGDEYDSRVSLGPEVNFSQPSISLLEGLKSSVLLPTYPTPSLDIEISNPVMIIPTYADRPYLIGADISGSSVMENIAPLDLTPVIPIENTRPQIRPYYIHINDQGSSDSVFILIAEEYRGIEGSHGTARLHLYNSFGDPMTYPGDMVSPPYTGSQDHLWSVAIGNVDGRESNSWGDWYPNNKGNEIIVTSSSREFSVPSNRLSVLRYNSGPDVAKPTPPNSYLYQFDTIATQRINGWVAAVNDLDGADDLKDEIILVDGSVLRIMRMKNYDSYEFRNGVAFDTVAEYNFPNQTISNVSVADLEGDGLNDIIVTTFDSTFIIGTRLNNIIDVTSPTMQSFPPESFCAGDTIKIEWENKWLNYIPNSNFVNIYFRLYDVNGPLDSLILIVKDISNEKDSMIYIYAVDSLILGLTGRFIVEDKSVPGMVSDSTAVFSFNLPEVVIDSIHKAIYTVGTTIRINGTAYCLDSVALEYSYDLTNWEEIGRDAVGGDGRISFATNVPCPPIFGCSQPDIDSIIYYRMLGSIMSYSDTSEIMPAQIQPQMFTFTIDSCKTACPSRIFRWNLNALNLECDTIDISISVNRDNSYSFIDRFPAIQEKYEWNIPLGIPDSVIVRICCENSCMRADTTLTNLQPKYISIVAPNPFKPPIEIMEVIYEVPSETNVSIKIYDQNNRLVAEPVKNQFRRPKTAYCDRWAGDIWDGSVAANGIYYLCLELSSGAKEVYPVFIRK